MQFLDDLDSLHLSSNVPSTTAETTATSTQEALSFLDELANTTTTASSESNSNTSSSKEVPQKPAQIIPTIVTDPPPAVSAPAMKDTVTVSQSSAQSNSWNWNSLWNTAQSTAQSATSLATKVTSTTLTKGLETVYSISEETSKSLAIDANLVKGLINNVSNESSKLKSELTHFTSNLVDTIAPPLPISGVFGGYKSKFENMKVIADTLTVWTCFEAVNGENLDAVHDFVQETVNELWLDEKPDSHVAGGEKDRLSSSNPEEITKDHVPKSKNSLGVRICSKVVVNSVTDPSPKHCSSYTEALENIEAVLFRLKKLSDANPPKPTQEVLFTENADELEPQSYSVYLVIQPFTSVVVRNTPPSVFLNLALPETDMEQEILLQYLVVLVYPVPKSDGSVTSRSNVVVSRSVQMDTNVGIGRERRQKEMRKRVLEEVLVDLLEEVVVDLLYFRITEPSKSGVISLYHHSPTHTLLMDLVISFAEDLGLSKLYASLPPSIAPYFESSDQIYRQIASLFIVSYVGINILYFSFATLDYLFLFDKTLKNHPKYLPNQISREIWLSWTSFPTTVIVTIPWWLGELRGYSKIYYNIDDYGWPYFIFSLVWFILFSDCLIYWIHRFEHHPMLYWWLHKQHHMWKISTPFASHAFHPLDGYFQSIPYHLFVYLFPFNAYAYLVLFVLINFWTISIHDAAYFTSHPWINGAAHHTVHHLEFNYNYGQYFTLWDRIGGSHRLPEYEFKEEMIMDKWKNGKGEFLKKGKNEVDSKVESNGKKVD
ncbi:c-5 sterol desaturase [Nowakowskiella sp. JEL0407]|nr:c-5 sterol desaturase [Nowakowskiella sp. JEL0407]KAJ3127061.1 c-5 sterol desaturase [Nowakowskiella sp. JEL0407]